MSEVHHDVIGPDEPDRRSGRWLHLSAWVVALVVFEMTADPSLVVVVGCSKFGWAQLRAARWLRKSDPNRRRGRACGWFYVSWGLWRISIVATLLMFVVIFLFQILRERLGAAPKVGNAPPIQFVMAFLVAFFGFAFSTLTSIFGVVSAWRSRTRVWVGRAGINSFRGRTWPPVTSGADWNRIGGLLLTAVPLALLGGSFLPLSIVLTIAWIAARGIAGEIAAELTIYVGGTFSIIAGAIVLLALMDAAKRRMEARSPADCWGDQTETPPPSNQITFGNALR